MKIINLILGLGTAIILGSLIHFGIRAFHPEPKRPDYSQVYPKAAPFREYNCDKADLKCISDRDEYYENERIRQEGYEKQNKVYEDALRVYNRDVFIIANIVGVLVFVAGFTLLFKTAIASQSVPIGIMIAGLYSIIYGYVRGWNSTNDQMKFFVGLVIALLVIGGSIWLIERYSRKTR